MLFVRCRDASLGSTTLNYALGLEISFKALAEALNKTSAFTASTKFEGIIGLATEVPAKKVCLFRTYVQAKLAYLFNEYQYFLYHAHACTHICLFQDQYRMHAVRIQSRAACRTYIYLHIDASMPFDLFDLDTIRIASRSHLCRERHVAIRESFLYIFNTTCAA